MRKSIFWGILFGLVFCCFDAFAGDAGGGSDPIFGKLAGKATQIGQGLQDAGFIIAGLGLIVFTFMAIFNKIQWKTLAYIMFSTAVLSAMAGIISYISNGKGRVSLRVSSNYMSTSASSNTDVQGDARQTQVSHGS